MKVLNIAWHTVNNCTRQPFYLISFLFTVIIAIALPVLSQFSLYDQQRMLTDSLFGLILTIGIILNILINEYSIGSDFSNGRSLLLFSKPIGRTNYALGKLLGNSSSIVIFLGFSWLVVLNMQSVVIQNFFFNYYKFASFIFSVVIAFIVATIIHYFFNKNFSLTTLVALFITLPINTIFWLNQSNNPVLIGGLVRQGKIYLMLAFFIIFIGAAIAPIAVKLKASGILIYTILIITAGILTPKLFPSINDYWLIDYYYSGIELSYSLILKGLLNILIYSLFFTTVLQTWLKHTQLAKN